VDEDKIIVHLDLKPDNVLIAPGMIAKITDFGMGHILDVQAGGRQQVRRGGSARYMAPEQWKSQEVSVATDVYAFGVMFYEMLVGTVPFNFSALDALKRAHLSDSADLTKVPENVAWIVERSLAKHPNNRFQSFQELYDAIHEVYVELYNEEPQQRSQSEHFTAEEYVNRAATYFRLNSYEDALQDIEAALLLAPGAPYLMAYKGFALSHLEKYEEAREHLQQALNELPESAQINYMLGLSYYHGDELEVALPYFDKAYELDPTLLSALYQRGMTLARLERAEESLRDVTQIIREKPNQADLYYFRSLLYHMNKQSALAIEDLTRTLRLNPNYHPAYLTQAEINYEHYNRPQEALQNLRDHNAIQPDNAEAWSLLGRVCLDLKLFQEAVNAYNQLIRLQGEASIFYCLRARAYTGNKQFQEAIADCNKAMELDPESGLPYSMRGMAYNEMDGHTQQALDDFAMAAKLDPKDTVHMRGKSIAYANMESHELGLTEASKLIIHSPDEKWAYYVRAYFLEHLKRYDEALQDLNTALAKAPNFQEAIIARGELYVKRKEFELAEVDFQSIYRRNPRSYDALTGLGRVREKTDRQREALRYYERAARLGQPRAAYYYNRLCGQIGLPGLDYDPFSKMLGVVIGSQSPGDLQDAVTDMPFLVNENFLGYLMRQIIITNNRQLAQQITHNLKVLKRISYHYHRRGR
jgi:tetratricopeptide (TPR) repeat protein